MAYVAATIKEAGTTSTSVTVRVFGYSGYARFEFYIRLANGSGSIFEKNPYENSTAEEFTKTIAGLEPGTDYVMRVGCIITGNDIVEWSNAIKFSTSAAQTRPDDWDWWSTVARDQPIAISAVEWTAFYAKIDEFRAYTGRPAWPNFIPVRQGTVISAEIVNEVRAAIAPITTAPWPDYIVPGDTITAEYFNSLRDFLNSVT